MSQSTLSSQRGGWQQDEIDLLFQAVKDAAQNSVPLRDVFEDVGGRLSRKPNSIRNFYYARVRDMPEMKARQTPFRAFDDQELRWLIRNVLIGRGRGESVRACVARLSEGDRASMLRYQNKYRSILKNKPELLMETARELRAEGLPCPETVVAYRRYSRSSDAKSAYEVDALSAFQDDEHVQQIVGGLLGLLSRLSNADERTDCEQRWLEARREADRLRVEVDLLKLALEDQQNRSD